MDGALMEVGPYRLKNDTHLEFNDGSWDEFANLLFVDQPVGTGFSFVNSNMYLHELDQVGEHFLVFLEKFFELFPQYEDDDVCLYIPLPHHPIPRLVVADFATALSCWRILCWTVYSLYRQVDHDP